jgi:hypothetical protein
VPAYVPPLNDKTAAGFAVMFIGASKRCFRHGTTSAATGLIDSAA